MLKNRLFYLFFCFSIFLGCFHQVQGQSIIAYWNFDDMDLYIDGGTIDNQGKMVQNSAAGTYTFPAGAGTSGYAASSNKWEAGYNVWAVATYDYYYDPIVTTGYGCLKISSVQRSSATGPKNFTLEYSFDSWTWYTVPGASNIVLGNDYTKGVVNNVSLPSACDNQPMVFIRWAMTDLTAVGGGNVAASGTSRIENIVVTGYAVPDPSGMISGPISVSQGQNGVTYTVNPIANATSYNWYLPPGAVITSGSNTNTITVDFSGSASSGNISVEGMNSCGIGSITDLFITVGNAAIIPVITPLGSTTLCMGDSVVLQSSTADSYLWSTGETTQSIVIKPFSPGSYYYTVDATTNGSTATSLMENIDVNPLPIAFAGIDVMYCNGDSISLGSAAIPGDNYSWIPSSGLSDATASNPMVHASNSTSNPLTLTYVLIQTVQISGCSSTDTVQVSIQANPKADAGIDVAYCDGDSISIGNSGQVGIAYSWSPSAGLSNPNAAITAVHTGNKGNQPLVMQYILTAIDNSTSCKNADTVQVTIHTNPIADAGITANINPGDSTMLQGSGGISYVWSPANTLSNANIDMPYAHPNTTTLYTLTVSDINGCKASDTVTVIVNLSTTTSSIQAQGIQMVAYPNPWISAARIHIANDGSFHDYMFKMYDMQGNLVREVNHITGNTLLLMRENLPAGMYVYKILENDILQFKGKMIAE